MSGLLVRSAGPPVHRSASHGFTFLELIIALTILGLMATVTFSSFRTALNSYETSQERLEFSARKRVLQDQIKRQIGSLFPVRPSGSFLDAADTDAEGQPSLPQFARTPLFSGTPDSVTFATVAPLLIQENPGLTMVRYGLAQDEWGNFYVGAMEAPYTGLESFMAMASSAAEPPLVLIEDVMELQFQYYGFDVNSGVYDWFDSWYGEEMLTVPRAIKINFDENHLIVPVNASFTGARPRQRQGVIRR